MHSEKLEKITALLLSQVLGGKIISIRLSDKYNPHFAKILLQNFQNKRIAVVAELQSETAESLLTAAILWFDELGKLKTKAAEKLWVVSAESTKLAGFCTLLQENWQKKIRIFDLRMMEVFHDFTETASIEIGKFPQISERLEKIISLAPEKIHVQGSNLLFNGLPFLRFTKNKIWFGTENQRKLEAENWHELLELVENLAFYRRSDSPNKTHTYYRSLPEAWLEAMLRNDIAALDANLILSPVYDQFRCSSERFDLLSLRKDGRLVIIEIKVSPNREHLLQTVGYWQEMEKQRIAGNLYGLFGSLPVADAPSLVYLVAPHSAFHKDFFALSEAVSKKIPIYRFDLNENWREKLEVLERQRL